MDCVHQDGVTISTRRDPHVHQDLYRSGHHRCDQLRRSRRAKASERRRCLWCQPRSSAGSALRARDLGSQWSALRRRRRLSPARSRNFSTISSAPHRREGLRGSPLGSFVCNLAMRELSIAGPFSVRPPSSLNRPVNRVQSPRYKGAVLSRIALPQEQSPRVSPRQRFVVHHNCELCAAVWCHRGSATRNFDSGSARRATGHLVLAKGRMRLIVHLWNWIAQFF